MFSLHFFLSELMNLQQDYLRWCMENKKKSKWIQHNATRQFTIIHIFPTKTAQVPIYLSKKWYFCTSLQLLIVNMTLQQSLQFEIVWATIKLLRHSCYLDSFFLSEQLKLIVETKYSAMKSGDDFQLEARPKRISWACTSRQLVFLRLSFWSRC